MAVTGNAMPDEIHQFLEEGADLVVTSKCYYLTANALLL